MCGSGGGGDGGAAEREAARQKKQDAAVGRINSLFGVSSNADATPLPDRNDNRFYTMVRPAPFAPPERTFNQSLYDQAVAEAGQNGANNTEAEANKLKLDSIYQGVGDDVSASLTKDLNDQYEVAERNGRFNAARRGIRGGSSELDMQDTMQENYDKGVLDVSNKASNASLNMRNADSKTRLNMVQRILQGMSGDAAITSAQQSMRDNTENIRRQSLSQSLDNVFGDTAYINNQRLKQQGAQRANDYYGTYYPSNKSYSGVKN